MPSAVTVGATTGTLTSDSRWVVTPNQVGQEYGSNYGPAVDLFAPGANVRVATHGSPDAIRTVGTSGTSFAVAYASGVAARILWENPYFTPAQLSDQIKGMATKPSDCSIDLTDCFNLLDRGLGSPNLLLHNGYTRTRAVR